MLPTKQKLYQDLSYKEKRLFSYEELFDSHKYMKKYLLMITILITICETIKLAVNPLGELTPEFKVEIFIVPVIISMGAILCFISHLKTFERKTSKIVVIRLIFLSIANMCFCSGVFLNVYAFMTLANQNKDTKSWFDAVTYVSKGSFITILGSMVHPIWQLKATVPIAYFLAVFVSYLKSDQTNIGLAVAELITSMVYIVSLFAVAEYFRYQQFIRKCESDDWKIIHGCILERVNNAIVVVNPGGQVVYSNTEFDNMSKGDPKSFFAKMRHIRKRAEESSDQELSYLNICSPKFSSIEESQLNILSATRFSKLGLLKRPVDEITDANELIEIVNQSIHQGILNDGTYFTFDGKLMEDETEEAKQHRSYEIAVSSMSSYDKIILIFHDTTQHARIVALETNNHYKDKLLASVSHELRTPLNGNLALLETTLNHDEVSQSVKDQLLVPAYRSGKLLGYLINDILDYSQIKVEKLRMTFKPSPLKNTLMSCYQLLEIQAKAKKLDLIFDIDQRIPEDFVTDHDRVVQVILNLLSNALKFTFKGEVTLKACLVTNDKAEDGIVEIQVTDTGIGIKPEDTSKLFQEFMQLEGEDERKSLNSKGVGLGLTIADQLVRRLSPNGSQGISVKSVFGQGSCFSFLLDSKMLEAKTLLPNPQNSIMHQKSPVYFTASDSSDDTGAFQRMDEYIVGSPLGREPRRSRVPSFNYVPSSSMHQMQQILSDERIFKTVPAIENPPVVRKKGTILIVDDEPFNILALQSMIQSSGFLVESAFNGREAVEKVTQQYENSTKGELIYELIFMDCQMPIMDGYEATKILCDIMKDKIIQIPIIGCTAFTAKSKMDDCIKVGMKHVINKPVTRKGIDEILRNYIGSTQLVKGRSYC